MNLWERFLRIIYKTTAKPYLKKYNEKSLESVLQQSLSLLDDSIINEIKNRVKQWISVDGGFTDRGGKTDPYYSMFGCFVAEALSVNEVFPQLKEYVKKMANQDSLTGIHLYCGAILYSKLHGFDSTTEKLRERVEIEIESETKEGISSGYTFFLGLLTLYYLQDYRNMLKLKKKISVISNEKDSPCSLSAAEAVINSVLGKSLKESEVKLKSFYKGKGGFLALNKSPIEDLLSTAVALYALHFIDSDIKNIKPDCLSYVDGLYLNGGFCATEMDYDIDIEYTFYALLALGSLS